MSDNDVVLPIKKKKNKIIFVKDDESDEEDDFIMTARQQKYYDILCEIAEQRGFKIIGKYVDNKTKIKMKCKNDHIFEITPNAFKSQGNGCSRCSNKCTIQAEENFYQEAEKRKFKVIGKYINAKTKILMKCYNNHIVEITPHNFKNKEQGCAKCSNKCCIQSEENFRKEAHQRNFEIIGEYVSTNRKIKMKCSNNHFFKITINHFKSGTGCNICNMSGISIKIKQILDDNKIDYKLEYCINKNKLRYDFYLIDYNSVIEVDGDQHFYFTEHFHKNEEKFEEARQRDIVKYQQCKNLNIQMIRLDYKWIAKNSNDEIFSFIEKSLSDEKQFIFSTPELYEDWICKKLPKTFYEKYDVKPPKIKIVFI
jgi:hypothetical protein